MQKGNPTEIQCVIFGGIFKASYFWYKYHFHKRFGIKMNILKYDTITSKSHLEWRDIPDYQDFPEKLFSQYHFINWVSNLYRLLHQSNPGGTKYLMERKVISLLISVEFSWSFLLQRSLSIWAIVKSCLY